MDRYFNSDVIAIIETDADLRIVRANPGACKLLGYTVDEFQHLTWMDLAHPDDAGKARDQLGPLVEHGGPAVMTELRFRTRDGRTLDVALNVQAGDLDRAGKPANYIGFIMDISRRRGAEREIIAVNRRMDDLHHKISRALSDTLASRDPYTASHQNQVARLAGAIAARLGLPDGECRAVAAAASVHDIGKAAIPSDYLSKPGKLDALEIKVIQTHALRGFEILRPLDSEFPVAEIVYQHHERLDGSGYPRGLCNGAVLLEAQIVAAADIADSIVNSRPYRRALGRDRAIAELTGERGTRLREDVVDSCVAVLATMA